MNKIVAGTRNAGKVREIRQALAELPFEVSGIPDEGLADVEETGVTFSENAILKARYYALHTGEYCLADDSGLEVDALDGAPGVYSARYSGQGATDAANNQKLLLALQDVPPEKRTARFRSVLALACPDGSLLLADGTCEGVILTEARGEGGFGYDPLFWVPTHGCASAQLPSEVKQRISHRGLAMASLLTQLS